MASGGQRDPQRQNTSNGKGLSTAMLVAVLVFCLLGAALGVWYLVTTGLDIGRSQSIETVVPGQGGSNSSSGSKSTSGSASSSSSGSSSKPDAPVDFKALKAENKDVYAWIKVPGTNIDYPVCQSSDNDNFYLTHNYKREESKPGAIFSQRVNTRDFDDPVTVLYGHNGFGNTMFNALHSFEDAAFFGANDVFYIYVPKHVYTYKIISAYIADDRDLIAAYDFSKASELEAFEAELQDPGSMTRQVNGDINLNANSKIVVLSTCNTGVYEGTGRYLVSGVMVDDTATQ